MALIVLGVGFGAVGLTQLTDWRLLATRASQGPISRHHRIIRGRLAWRVTGGFMFLFGLSALIGAVVGRPG